MQFQHSPNSKAPLLSWDLFSLGYNNLSQGASQYLESVSSIRQIARTNKWSDEQMGEAIANIQQYVVVITDHLQKISFTGKGFYEMTGYTFEEAKGRNPRFLQGPSTNRSKTSLIRQQLSVNKPAEMILENYRRDGQLYLCKILIKPILSSNRKLVNYIAYEQEIAA